MSDTSETVGAENLGGDGEFSVGAVVGDTFKTFFGNIVLFSILISILILPFIIIDGASFSSVADGSWVQSGDPISYLWIFFGVMLVGFFSQIGIIYGSVESLSGNKANVREMFSTIIRCAIPVLIASILVMVMMMVGFVLLVIPGFMVVMMMAVVVPVIVVERVGIIKALSRSRELTNGHKWGIFGAFFLLGIINVIVQFILSFVGDAGGEAMKIILLLLNQVIATGLTASMVASIYINLRRAKEGVNVEEIAKVFE